LAENGRLSHTPPARKVTLKNLAAAELICPGDFLLERSNPFTYTYGWLAEAADLRS